MNFKSYCLRRGACCVRVCARAGAGAGEDRHGHDAVGPGRLSRAGRARRVQPRDRDGGRQARRRAGAIARRGRRAQARTGQGDRRTLHEDRAHEAAHRHHVLERRGRGRARHSRQRRRLREPERGPLELRRQGMPQELLRRLAGRTTPCTRAPGRTPPTSASSAPSCSRRTIRPGSDAIAGFKRFFKGEVVGEIYTRLDQTDFAPEMAQIRAAKPDVVFQFHPGGLGISFARQYQQAGLLETIPMVCRSALARRGDPEGHRRRGARRAHFQPLELGLANDANKEFVAAFQKKYGRMPTYYAARATTRRAPSAPRSRAPAARWTT